MSATAQPAPSYWLEELGPIEPRSSLTADAEADVVIVGGGFSGLWTAWYLIEFDPSLRIVILEAEYIGFGASGRNGGWCTPGMALAPSTLEARYGRDAARAVIDTMREAVDEIGEVASSQSIECNYRKTGRILLARGTAQLPALRSSHEAMVALDRADGVEWLDGPEVRARIHATSIEAGSRDSHCATIQPAKLARGLAVALEQRGVRIYEKTRVQEIVSASERYTAQVHCPEAVARAPVVSVSSEAWTARLEA